MPHGWRRSKGCDRSSFARVPFSRARVSVGGQGGGSAGGGDVWRYNKIKLTGRVARHQTQHTTRGGNYIASLTHADPLGRLLGIRSYP